MALVVDEEHPGTAEAVWLATPRLSSLTPLQVRLPRRVALVAPHPDDEVLGAGGLLQQISRAGVKTELVAVTDGEASHPDEDRGDVAAKRAAESRLALARLGCAGVFIRRLHFPDGSVTAGEDRLAELLSRLLVPGDLCVAPWRSDGHPDHDATGRAAYVAACSVGVPILEYLVWAWHWATPESQAVPWDHCRRLDLAAEQTVRKRWATRAFASQIRPRTEGRGAEPVLPGPVLQRFWRPFEVYIETVL